MAGAAAGVMALTATAWACTQNLHNLTVVVSNTTSRKTGPALTAVTASGQCVSTAGCPTTGTVNLHQDATPSTGNKGVYDHQLLCTSADPDIGDVTFSSGSITSGSGVIETRAVPGPYIVCAGDTDAATEILWDVFTLS